MLGRDDERTVFALKDRLCAVLDKLWPALDCDGEEDLGLRVRRGDVEGDIVEVGDDLVD